MAKEKFYTLDNILKHKADYNVIYGERSNGKTTAVLKYALIDYINSGYVHQLAVIRRWDEDLKAKEASQMMENLVKLGWIEELTNGLYNSIYYYSKRWYLCYYDEDGKKVIQTDTPFALGFSISNQEHYKSTPYPDVRTILFDEFITRKFYLPDEFISFQNLLSTIIRLRDDVTIFMCGNSVNKFCPYFNEMGLTGVKKQKIGTIDIYSYGESTLKVAVEYSDFPSKKKASNKYFAFDNPKLKMITQGSWEIDIYPHLPEKYLPKNVVYQFYVIFDREILHCNIISLKDKTFLYIHRKTTPIKEDNTRIVYQQEIDYRRNYRTNILKPIDKIDIKIKKFFDTEKVFYQDNEVGEVMANYLKWCKLH